MNKKFKVTLALMAAPMAIACSNKASFDGAATSASSAANTTPGSACQPGTSLNVAKATKILFLVDISGSNNYATDSTGTVACGTATICIPATDPVKSFRYGVISRFFNEYKSHANVQWGIATFAGSTAQSLILSSAQQPVFTADQTKVQVALTNFLSIQDWGNTPYGSALTLANQMIQSDPDLKLGAKPNYDVILLTDGFPTDYVSANGNFNLAGLESSVQSLIATPAGQISLSTVYYGAATVPGAVNLLQQLASIGLGKFANENGANPGFQIDDVVNIPVQCQ